MCIMNSLRATIPFYRCDVQKIENIGWLLMSYEKALNL